MIIDGSEVRALERTLTRAGGHVYQIGKVVERAAVNIKKDWQQRWSGIAHAPALPAAITYDPLDWAVGSVRTEIGPDKQRRQGALGNIIEFGTKNNGPIPGGLPALAAETPRFEKAVGVFGVRLLER